MSATTETALEQEFKELHYLNQQFKHAREAFETKRDSILKRLSLSMPDLVFIPGENRAKFGSTTVSVKVAERKEWDERKLLEQVTAYPELGQYITTKRYVRLRDVREEAPELEPLFAPALTTKTNKPVFSVEQEGDS